MTEVNFSDLLNVQVQTAERPKSFPIGDYNAIVTGYEFGKSRNKETPYVQFNVTLLGPLESVDDELFEDAGGMEALNARKPLRHIFYITPGALFILRKFMENSLDLNCDGRTFDEVIPEATNVPLVANIKHDAGQEPGEVYMKIDSTAKAA